MPSLSEGLTASALATALAWGAAACDAPSPASQRGSASTTVAASRATAPPQLGSPSASSEPTSAASALASASTGAVGSAVASASGSPSASPCPAGMALVPGGELRPRKRRERRQVEPFCLDVTEVTVDDYTACARAERCKPACRAGGRCALVPAYTEWAAPGEDVRASRYCNGGKPDKGRHPMNCVSLEEAFDYCAALGKRLPRPSEWEWAAQGARSDALYPWGNAHVADQLCWRGPAWRWGTCEAGGTPGDVSPQGVFDLAGNVTEWVEPDGPARGVLYSPEQGEPAPSRPRFDGPQYGFGASWYAKDDGYPRAAIGGIGATSPRSETFGFRCARDAP